MAAVVVVTAVAAWRVGPRLGGGGPAPAAAPTTTVNLRGLSGWQFGFERLFYCSRQSATLQGWRLDLGPVGVRRLWASRPAAAAGGGSAGVTPVTAEK